VRDRGPRPSCPGPRRRRCAASIRPPGRPRSAGDLRRHASGGRLGSGPLYLPHVRPTMASGRARLVTGRRRLMRRAPSVAGSRRQRLLVPGEGPAPGWLDCRPQRKRASPAGDGLGQRSGLQDRRHEGRAGALVAVASDALKGSKVRRRWPLPETTEPERASGLARGAVRKRRRRLAVAGIFGSPPLFGSSRARTADVE
jgi:hypothetical protein